MPWDNQSGGPNGGNNNPWGNNPRQQGPDIDAWLNQLQENIKKYIPGGGSGSGVVLLLVGLLVLWGAQWFLPCSSRRTRCCSPIWEVSSADQSGFELSYSMAR